MFPYKANLKLECSTVGGFYAELYIPCENKIEYYINGKVIDPDTLKILICGKWYSKDKVERIVLAYEKELSERDIVNDTKVDHH